jgi:hypothetical protein
MTLLHPSVLCGCTSKLQASRSRAATPSPPPRYSAPEPRDRLLVTHPSPSTSDPRVHTSNSPRLPNSTSEPEILHSSKFTPANTSYFRHPFSQIESKKCAPCQRSLEAFEYLSSLPTKTCQHKNDICVYCLHESVRQAVVKTGGWEDVKCPNCGERMDEGEVRRAVLLWDEEQGSK